MHVNYVVEWSIEFQSVKKDREITVCDVFLNNGHAKDDCWASVKCENNVTPENTDEHVHVMQECDEEVTEDEVAEQVTAMGRLRIGEPFEKQ